MKKIFLLGILLLSHFIGRSCTIIPDPFCKALDFYPDYLVITGIIVAIDTTGINIEILDILRGEESREVIRIWDGTDFECNGTWPMAASGIGNLSDTVIIMLPKIVKMENTWDVIGDYRRPNPYFQVSELSIEKGLASGFISGDLLAPPEYNVWSMNYEDFMNFILTDGDCSSIILDAHDISNPSNITINNPVESILYVQLTKSANNGYIKLYSLTGDVILKEEVKSELSIELNLYDLPAGMYLVEIHIDGKREVRKIIKQNKN
jgi:hypothetical protein